MMAAAAGPDHGQQIRPDSVRQASDRQSQPSSRRHGPTTPLRRVSRGSFSKDRGPNDPFPLDSLEPAFAELSDALTDLNANFEQLQEMHNSLARFSESFASFLYGLNMNAFCNEFPQVRLWLRLWEILTGNRRLLCNLLNVLRVKCGVFSSADALETKQKSTLVQEYHQTRSAAHDMTMTTDTSFVERPATKSSRTPTSERGAARGRGRGTTRGGRTFGR